MKLLVLSRCLPYPLHLGDRLILYHLARGLAGGGHTLDLIAFSDPQHDPVDPAPYADWFRRITLIPAPRPPAGQLDHLWRLIDRRRWFPKRAADSRSPAFFQATADHVADTFYDAVYVLGGVQVYEYTRAFAPLPAVITPYESYALYLQRAIAAAGSPLLRARLYVMHALAQAYEAFMFAPYTRVTVVSEPDQQMLLRASPTSSIVVIPNGVDCDHFSPSPTIARDPRVLVFTGNFSYAPNIDAAQLLAHHILPRVRERFPDARLILAGADPVPSVRALAAESVTVTGRVPDLRPYLAQAGVFVSPLRIGAGIKNKLLEAMAMGAPIVATPISFDGIAAVDGIHARIAPVDAIADAVIALLDSPQIQLYLAKNARDLVESGYSWSRVVERYLEQLEDARR